MRSAYHTFSLLLLPPWGEDFAPAPAWETSQRIHSSNFSNMSPGLGLSKDCQDLFVSLWTSMDCRGLHRGLQGSFALPKSAIPEVLPPLLMNSVLAISGSVLKPAGIGSIRHRSTSRSFSQKAPLSLPPVPNLCHANPVH